MWLLVLLILAGMAVVFFYKKPLNTSGAYAPPPQPPWPQPQPPVQPQIDQRQLAPPPNNGDQQPRA